MKLTKTTWFIIGGVSLIAAGAGLYFFVLKPKQVQSDKYGNLKLKAKGKDKTNAAGVQVNKGEHATPVVEPSWENPFDMTYADDVKKWVAPKTLVVLKDQFAKQYAKELYDAKGVMDDDEQTVQNVFVKKMKDKVHVSNVSRAFWNLYQKDLYDYLGSFLSESELEKCALSPVRNLPNYRLA